MEEENYEFWRMLLKEKNRQINSGRDLRRLSVREPEGIFLRVHRKRQGN